jgi:hypothetical protein
VNNGQITVIDPRQTELERLESIIESGIATFVAVGQALAQIKADRLYLVTHKSFDAYCRERWSFSGRYGNLQIEAARDPDARGARTERKARAFIDARKAAERAKAAFDKLGPEEQLRMVEQEERRVLEARDKRESVPAPDKRAKVRRLLEALRKAVGGNAILLGLLDRFEAAL